MDAALFIRFTTMCRNIFLVLGVVGCGILLPVFYSLNSDKTGNQRWFMRLTPSNVNDQPVWAIVVTAYIFNFVIIGFLWWNYREVLKLRRVYFETKEYQQSLSARTLMVSPRFPYIVYIKTYRSS